MYNYTQEMGQPLTGERRRGTAPHLPLSPEPPLEQWAAVSTTTYCWWARRQGQRFVKLHPSSNSRIKWRDIADDKQAVRPADISGNGT